MCCPHNGWWVVREAAGPIKDDPDPKLLLLNAGTISASCEQGMWRACELMIHWDAMLCNASQVASSTLQSTHLFIGSHWSEALAELICFLFKKI